jgi:hypothetical protein
VNAHAEGAMSSASHAEHEGKAATCGACGACYTDEAWTKLALSRRIEPREIGETVRHWPDDRCVEVRSCGRCARLMAVLRRRS